MENPILRSMRILGLTPYEAKAYHTLVEYGEMTARTLSGLSDIPYSKVYEVLDRLQERGFVEVQKARPMVFKAASPASALERYVADLLNTLKKEYRERSKDLEERHEARVREISEALRMLRTSLQALYEGKEVLEPSEELIWTIKGRRNVLAQIEQLIKESSQIRMILPQGLVVELEETLRKAKGEVIIDLGEKEGIETPRGLTIYRMEETPFKCLILIADGRNTLFTSEGLETAFKSSNLGVATILNHFFQHEKEEASLLSSMELTGSN